MSDLTLLDDTFDKIERYYRENGKLSTKETEICERWEFAFALYSSQRNKKIAVRKYISIQKSKGEELSIAQAYRDFANAERIFTPLYKYNKEFLKLVIIESSLNDIKKCNALAVKQTDVKLWAEIMKVKDKAEKRIIEASGLTLNDPNLPDFTKLQANQFNINLDPTMIEMLKKVMNHGVVDVTQLFYTMKNDTEDATELDD
jgi:hypothetical protein